MVALRRSDGSSTRGNSFTVRQCHILEAAECFFNKYFLALREGTYICPSQKRLIRAKRVSSCYIPIFFFVCSTNLGFIGEKNNLGFSVGDVLCTRYLGTYVPGISRPCTARSFTGRGMLLVRGLPLRVRGRPMRHVRWGTSL